jgi:hypothetical protein
MIKKGSYPLMTTLFIIMFGISVSLALIYSVLFIICMVKDYQEAEKAHKKFQDENNYYL